MTALRQLVIGLAGAIISGLLVLGALTVASVEGMIYYTPTAENTATAGLPIPGQDTSTPAPTNTPVFPTGCPPPPADWQSYFLQNGDTLESLALLRGTTIEVIIEGNCLVGKTLMPDTSIYLPPLPTATSTMTLTATPLEPTKKAPDTAVPPTEKVCGAPPSWPSYVIQPGDTLFSLATATGTTVNELMVANCLTDANHIIAGMTIRLPRLPVHTAPPTNTARPPTKTGSGAAFQYPGPAAQRYPCPAADRHAGPPAY